MAVNKVVYNGQTLIDTSNDTVSADTLLKGVTAHDKSGEVITGTYEGGAGLTKSIKQALLNCFQHVAWDNDQGQTYYDSLHDALYPPTELVSIGAVYTQSDTVYDTDTLDSLRQDLVVTATYEDSTTETITTYTLSGTLAEGTSTITVSYGGKTTTFNVTVTNSADPSEEWTDGVPYTINLIQNEYVNNTNGVITSYKGWDRTDYLPCHGAAAISVSPISLGEYNGWYDASKGFIGKFIITTSTTQILVPSNAHYFIVSGSRANMAKFDATPHETAEE